MKVNREQFLAAALLFAATTGCGKITEKMHSSMGVTADPAADQPIQGAGLGIDPNTTNNPANTPAGMTKTNPVRAKQPAPPTPKIATKSAGPTNEGAGPANENVAPAKENVAPANENVAPSKENFGPSNENVGPSGERWRRRGGPSSEGWGPSSERGGRRGGPSSENTGPSNEKPLPRPVPSSRPRPKRG